MSELAMCTFCSAVFVAPDLLNLNNITTTHTANNPDHTTFANAFEIDGSFRAKALTIDTVALANSIQLGISDSTI